MKAKSPRTKKLKQRYYEGIGRRKTAIARVRITPAKNGKSAKKSPSPKQTEKNHTIFINQKSLGDYFRIDRVRKIIEEPLKKLKSLPKLDISVKVIGGGITAQAQAITLGLARAIKDFQPQTLTELKAASLLTRDPRMKERKKPGKRGARRGQQWSKR